MTRPTTEAEYLASLVPASVRGVGRRTLLRGALGAGTLLAAPALLAACGGNGRHRRPAASAATGTVTVGSNQSDAVPKAAVQAVMDAFQKANTGLTVKVNTVDHNTFQENINNYLQGSPGRRLHLVLRLPDALLRVQGPGRRHLATSGRTSAGMSDALKKASTGDDGKQYFVPSTYYPWADLLPQERLRGEGLRAAQDPGRVQDPRRKDAEGRPRPDRLRATRTAGRRWARSTSSTCGSTATTSTSA